MRYWWNMLVLEIDIIVYGRTPFIHSESKLLLGEHGVDIAFEHEWNLTSTDA